MTDVFISYARADRNRVRPIALALAAEGFSVWWDPEIKPGAEWNAAIRRALENAACVMTCWSKKSSKSQWVLAETTHGHSRQALVPVMIQACTPPIPFNMIQSADLTAWRGDGSDHEWQGVLARVRQLVEAKRRLAAAAPPPGEAYGATRAATPVPAAEEPFAYTPSPQRFGPRLGQMLLGGAVITAVLTAGVFLAPRVIEQFAPASPRAEAPPVGEAAGPAEEAAGAPEDLSTAPAETPPPTTSPNQPPDTQTPSAQTPGAAPPPQTTPQAPAPTGPAADLDACANRLLALCPGYGGGAVAGFRADGRLSNAESQFLGALQIAASPPTPEAVAACRAVVQRRSSGATPSTRRTLFDQACMGLAPPPAPTTTPSSPPSAPSSGPAADGGQSSVGTAIIDALPQILGQDRDTATPRTGSATIPMGSLLDLGSGRVGSTGDLGLTRGYRRATAATAPQLGANDGVGIAAMGTGAVSQAACARASYGANPLPAAAGDSFCIRRRDGTYAAVTVASAPSDNGVTVRYQVWP